MSRSASGRELRFRTVEVPDPGDLLSRLPEAGGLAWVHHGDGLVGWGTVLHEVLPAGGDRFARAATAFEDLLGASEVDDPLGLPGTGPVAFVSVTFDPRSAGSVVAVPRVLLGRRDGVAWITTVEGAAARVPPAQAVPAPSRIRYAGSQVAELDWIQAVASATKAISSGALAKVVLARDVGVWSEEPLDPRALASRLAERFPSCFTFSCDGLVGATPELLVRRRGGEVTSVCLAGTAPRGADEAADAALGRALLASEKDRSEHGYAADSVRDALAPLLDGLTVEGPSLLRLDNVQHLATEVRGRLRPDAGEEPTALDLTAALHPTAAVCGTPTDVAMALIRELETFDRGRYTGPVGWVDGRGDGELGIALRCALVEGTRARLFAGNGIVAASLPEAELEETRLKLRAMQSALTAS